MTWQPVIYRDLWADDVRLLIDGQDVTYFRGAPAQVGGYQLTEPYGYGPADFAFPQVTELEVDSYGHGPLGWLHTGARAELVQVVDGTRVAVVWRGFLTSLKVSGHSVQVQADGDASGRLALRDAPEALRWRSLDIGLYVFDAFAHCGLPLRPHMGPITGIHVYNGGGGGDYLSLVDYYLGLAQTEDGQLWTVMPVGGMTRRYEMSLKDTTTVDATVFLGAPGVDVDLGEDLQEQPTAYYGSGTAPDGKKWNNSIHPQLHRGPAPDYPMAGGASFGVGTVNADTLDGDGITVMTNRLRGTGDLTRVELGGGFNADVADGVRAVQRQAGLPRTGNMNPATWEALFDVRVTGKSKKQAQIMPLVEAEQVRAWNRTASGALSGRNPAYDPAVIPVDVSVDHGEGVTKAQARRWSRLEQERLASQQWTGTIALTTDAFTGDYTPGAGSPVPLSRLDLRPGMNVMLRGFDGDTLLHVAGVDVGSDRGVSLAVDTHARDLLTIGEMRTRDRESRRHRARKKKHKKHRRQSMIRWPENGGQLGDHVSLGGDRWTVVEVPAGQAGTIGRLRLSTNPDAEYCVAVFGEKVKAGDLRRKVPNPLSSSSRWARAASQDWFDERELLYVAGDNEQPCGYWPGKKTGADGEPTGDPCTGKWRDHAGFEYRTKDKPVLYLAVYPDRACKLQGGDVMTRAQDEDNA